MEKTRFITDDQVYRSVLQERVPAAETFLWIATADMKDLYVSKGRRHVPFLEILSDLVKNGVQIRLIHAKEPGEPFRRDFDRYPNLIEGVERVLCPRTHFKTVVVDGKFAYTGSANLTGSGMGAKGINKRNFENGFITTDTELIQQIMEQFDGIWIGNRCGKCLRKRYCADYKEML